MKYLSDRDMPTLPGMRFAGGAILKMSTLLAPTVGNPRGAPPLVRG
eukprot:CAMPEP_0114173612 /NCGR_PEP_ID=MMETSP0043_2-20121206/35940_1 /TAXON_ID=464988 /ORGANISM="Hemiselmis andersenii, Strain CCMP644" /LENGTH=45 /DNA_ID= /DNA_START= /DNA_END= /DNA_ORIENTATION=